ncbi:MAG: hypothetical protein M3081_14690 [Gemmatimonadota bacterium]|nr:hypothetical protein [Gemmatimonadota bacterium]
MTPIMVRSARSLLVGGLLAIIAALVFLPLRVGGLRSHPRPVADYAAAVARFESMRTLEAGVVSEYGASRLLTHGAKAPKVALLLHGLTASPWQFDSLGAALFKLGYNVLIPRLPLHGERGRDVSVLNGLTAEKYRDLADGSVDIALGLGDTLDVIGLSGGATAAAWIAQFRSRLHRVLIIAPALGVAHVPGMLGDPVAQAAARLPNVTVHQGGEVPRPHVYAGFSTHAVAQTMRLGGAVFDAALRDAPRADAIVLITNGADHTIDNAKVAALATLWERRGARVTRFEFDAALGLTHDVIDPTEPCGDTAIVYPVLITLLDGRGKPFIAKTRTRERSCARTSAIAPAPRTTR